MTIGKLHHVDIAVVLNGLEATRQKTLIDEVIGVDKENPSSPGDGQSCVTCSRQSGITLMHHLDVVVQQCILIAYSAAVVGRPVINKNYFIIGRVNLLDTTVDTLSQIGLDIIYRKNNRYGRHGIEHWS